LLDEFHLFATKLRRLDRHSRDVPARSGQARNEAVSDWIGRGNHDDRDGSSRPPGREDLRHEHGQKDVDLEADQIRRKLRQAGRIAMGEAPFNCEVLALDVAEIAQRLGQELRGR
jgi:hypothetical protein